MYLRQSTASQEIALGHFLDSIDGNTEKTGLTIANTDIKLFKAGASSLVSKNSGGATHMANGVYLATLDATDTDTAGLLDIFVHVSGALAVKLRLTVLPAVVYDSIIAGSDNLQVETVLMANNVITASAINSGAITNAKFASGAIDATAIASSAITSSKIASGAITSAKFATDAIDANALAADAVAEIQTGLSASAIAEALLKFDCSTITGEADRSLINAIRQAISKWTISGGTVYTVFKEDDTTIAFTRTLVRTAGNPVSSMTP